MLVVVHGRVLLLAAHDGTHGGETALVVSAKARLVASADFAPFIGSAPLCFGLRRWTSPCLSWRGVKARGLASGRAWVPSASVLRGVVALARMAWILWGATVEGCAHRFSYASARTRHHPGTIAARGGRIWQPRACDPQTRALVCLPCEGQGWDLAV